MNITRFRPRRVAAFVAGAMALSLLCISPARSAEGVFEVKTLGAIFSGDWRPCVFFTLDGVPEAVAGVPGSPWFVLPKTHVMFKETFALLLTAKTTGRAVNVVTTGGVNACGHAEVLRVAIP